MTCGRPAPRYPSRKRGAQKSGAPPARAVLSGQERAGRPPSQPRRRLARLVQISAPPTPACRVGRPHHNHPRRLISDLPSRTTLIRPRLTNAGASRRTVGGSSNGRTPDSDSGCLGSNPSPPATHVVFPYPPKTWFFWLESVPPIATALGHIVGHNSFLERHGQGWRFRVRLPRGLCQLTADLRPISPPTWSWI